MPRKAKKTEELNEDLKKKVEKTNSLSKKAPSTNKKTTSKKTSVAAKKNTTSKNAKVAKKTETKKKSSNKVIKTGKELVELANRPTMKEENVIEKIKSFLSKIIEIQEETEKEEKENIRDIENQKSKTSKSKKVNEIKEKKPEHVLEYYDLPYRYNETVVKILAQTPKRLFIYWDISDKDRNKYLEVFGENFFELTYPILLLHNEDKDYWTETQINDFANSWYIDIEDSKSKYTIQLGRKFKEEPKIIDIAILEQKNVILQKNYVPIVESNKLETPNDHILFKNFTPTVKYKNIKTNQETFKNLTRNEYKNKIGKVYNIYDVYKELYKDEIEEGVFDMENPTSGSTSSSFK